MILSTKSRSLESGVASPVDIILVDEIYSASVVHLNDVGVNGESPIPTFAIPQSTFSLALAFVLRIPVTPQSQIVSLAVGVDDVNVNGLNINRAIITPARYAKKQAPGYLMHSHTSPAVL